MPCWERRTQTLNMAKANRDTMIATLKALSTNINEASMSAYVDGVTVVWNGTTLTGSGASDAHVSAVLKKVRQTYTKEAFRSAARKAGFTVAPTRERLVATRRRY